MKRSRKTSTHNEEKDQSTETDKATTQNTELVVRGETFIITVFHMFKKAEERLRLWRHGKYFF